MMEFFNNVLKAAAAKEYAFKNRQRLLDDLVEPYAYSMNEAEVEKHSGHIKVGHRGFPPTHYISQTASGKTLAMAAIIYDEDNKVLGYEPPSLLN